MAHDIIDTRRFFRNRFEYYMDNKDIFELRDGSRLTLRDLCRVLQHDPEPFPPCYDADLRKLCGHEYLTWFRHDRTYGEVTRLLARLFAAEDGLRPPVGGRWVQEVLNSSRAADYWLRSEEETTAIVAEFDLAASWERHAT